MDQSHKLTLKGESYGVSNRRDDSVQQRTILQEACTNSLLSSVDENLALELERDDEYYLEMIEFEVENIAYMAPKVHWSFTTNTSNGLEDMNVDSTLPSWPTDASTSDVCLFFKIIDLCIESYPKVLLSKNQWTQVLLFAIVWGLDDLRQFAILSLNSWIVFISERVTFGREYEIPSYLEHAFRTLVSRPSALTFREVELIGLASSVRLVQIRENIRHGILSDRLSPVLFQEVLDSLTRSTDMSSTLRNNDIIEDIQRAKAAGIKEWLREGYKRLVGFPAISPVEIAALELTQECTQSLVYAREVHWSIKRNYRERSFRDWNIVLLAVDQAVAHSFYATGAEAAKFDRRGELDLVTQLALAVEHRSRAWLQAVYAHLLIRHSPITLEEAKALGFWDFAALAQARELLRSSECTGEWVRACESDITRLAYDDLDAYLVNIDPDDGGHA